MVWLLKPCPREGCGGSVLMWPDGPSCLLCGRDPYHPLRLGIVERHQERRRRPDPYVSLARRVLDMPEVA